jgi:hypothetical protein
MECEHCGVACTTILCLDCLERTLEEWLEKYGYPLGGEEE